MKKVGIGLGVAFILFSYGAYKALLVFEEISSPGNIAMEELYRNVFFHVPVNATAFTAFTVTLAASLLYIKSRDLKYDLIASRATKLGLLFVTFTLITGSVWAKAAWGSYWNWDPRETTALVMWFVYMAYFALRGSIAETTASARASAIFGIFGYASGILTLLSTRVFPSLHPATFSLELEPEMGMVLGIMITASLIVFVNLLSIEVKVARMEESYGEMKMEEL